MNDLFGKKKEGVMDADNTLGIPVVKPKKRKAAPKKRGKKKVALKATIPVISQSAEEPRVPVTSVVLGRLIIKDAPSGEVYIFDNAGAVVPVRVQDIEHFRSKNRDEAHANCCSGTFMRKYFEIPA